MTSEQTQSLKMLGDLAIVLDSTEFLDGTSTIQKRGLREAADNLRKAIEEYAGELTAPVLMAFWSGAACQSHVVSTTNPIGTMLQQMLGGPGENAATTPAPVLMLVCAYMARDLLAGERVE